MNLKLRKAKYSGKNLFRQNNCSLSVSRYSLKNLSREFYRVNDLHSVAIVPIKRQSKKDCVAIQLKVMCANQLEDQRKIACRQIIVITSTGQLLYIYNVMSPNLCQRPKKVAVSEKLKKVPRGDPRHTYKY